MVLVMHRLFGICFIVLNFASCSAFYVATPFAFGDIKHALAAHCPTRQCFTTVFRQEYHRPSRARPLALRNQAASGGMDDLQPDEFKIEKMVEKLETRIESLVQKEQYTEAGAVRDELSRMHMDDTSAVLRCEFGQRMIAVVTDEQTNSDFYTAFSKKDIELMGSVWFKSTTVQCVHPGAKALVGFDEILGMWRSMFQAKDKVFRNTEIRPSHVRVSVRGTSAFVFCTEEVTAPGATRKMLATNIFRKYAGRWYLVHHHASQAAVRAGGGGGDGGGAGGLSATSLGEIMESGWNGNSARIIRIDGASLPQGTDSAAAASMMEEIIKAIQGALNDEGAGKGADGKGADIEIRGTDGGIVGSMMVIDDDEEEDERSSGGGGGGGGISSSGLASAGSGYMSAAAPDRYGLQRSGDVGEDSDDQDESQGDLVHERELMEDVTDRAVEALRTLARDGRITREHKRRLLTSIVEHHKEGGAASAVEIAYELLVMRFLRPGAGGGQREEELLDDFADQCKILAARLT